MRILLYNMFVGTVKQVYSDGWKVVRNANKVYCQIEGVVVILPLLLFMLFLIVLSCVIKLLLLLLLSLSFFFNHCLLTGWSVWMNTGRTLVPDLAVLVIRVLDASLRPSFPGFHAQVGLAFWFGDPYNFLEFVVFLGGLSIPSVVRWSMYSPRDASRLVKLWFVGVGCDGDNTFYTQNLQMMWKKRG